MTVALSDVTVRFGALAALAGVDLVVPAGQRLAIVGSSGAGKTTLLEVLAGLTAPTSGTVEVLGARPADLRGRRLRAHRARIGMVGQGLDIALPLRTIHNVNAGVLGEWSAARSVWSLVWPRGRDEAARALRQVGLDDRLLSRTEDLSGGERQRVAVARVLRQQPRLVLADEPTSSVDPQLADEVMALLCGRADTAPWTSIVSLHDPDLARRHADRIVGLRSGRVAFDRPSADVSDRDLTTLYATGG
jgi:phosphonate transport system ATP-binding protein